MVAPRGIFLLLILLVPTAIAQLPALPVEAPPTISVQLGAFAKPVMPGGFSQMATGSIEVSCALVATSPQTGLVVLFSATGPTWSSVVVDPPATAIDPKACAGPTINVPVMVAARGAHGGAAGDVSDVTLTASTTTPAGDQSGSASTPLTLGYYGAIDVKASATRATLSSFETGTFTLTVKNTGNARSLVNFAVTGTDAMKVDTIEPVVLEPQASIDKTVTFRSMKAVGTSGQTDPVSVNATSARERTGEIGSWKKVEVIVSTLASQTPPEEKGTPAPAGALVLAIVGVVALARRVRR